MGKFYEMFEMDAHVGADVLGLQYMKAGPAALRLPRGELFRVRGEAREGRAEGGRRRADGDARRARGAQRGEET